MTKSNLMNPLLINALNLIAEEVHRNAKSKGFYDSDETLPEFIARSCANMHGEISELWEACRKHELSKICDKSKAIADICGIPLNCEEEELADIIIRALDHACFRKIDIGKAVALKHAYNQTRSYRHGGKAA